MTKIEQDWVRVTYLDGIKMESDGLLRSNPSG